MKKLLIITVTAVLFSSCAAIFLPKKQKITINTNGTNAKVHVDGLEFVEGTTVVGTIRKYGPRQVVIETPGYKDNYNVLFPTHRPPFFWPLLILDMPSVIFYGGGVLLDLHIDKAWEYDEISNFNVQHKLVYKKNADKYIDFSKVNFSTNNKSNSVNIIPVKYLSNNLEKEIEYSENEYERVKNKIEIHKNKILTKLFGRKYHESDYSFNELECSKNIYKFLNESGYIDTVNKIFKDNSNTLFLEGNIKKINKYVISRKYNFYYKTKIFTTWYIKNTYNEILDSIDTKDYSGDFVGVNYNNLYKGEKIYDKLIFQKMYNDAMYTAYLNLHENLRFVNYLKQVNDFAIDDSLLNLSKPVAPLTEKIDANLATVIVKTENGHGSGFAITNDGYLITNYHIVAGKYIRKPDSITIIKSDGTEVVGSIVRVNKFRDLALIKVNTIFEKAFVVSNVKSFKSLQDVYAIGTPKSTELYQSVTKGIISSERKLGNNHLLQLGISINGGNSGGPLYDETGKLHGIIVSKLDGQNTEGVGFAIPSYMIEDYLKLKFK